MLLYMSMCVPKYESATIIEVITHTQLFALLQCSYLSIFPGDQNLLAARPSMSAIFYDSQVIKRHRVSFLSAAGVNHLIHLIDYKFVNEYCVPHTQDYHYFVSLHVL